MTDRKLRIGVIGVGHLGEYHVQKYREMPEVHLVGVVDINKERAEEIGRRYQTNSFLNHHDILEKVDAVSLAVPTETHYDVAKDVLSMGVHLLIEKPITYHLEPADTLIALAKDNNLVLQVGLVERFNPAVVGVESMVGDMVFIESHRMNTFTTRGTDVDVVLDLMIHDLDIILHLVHSEVKEIHAVGMTVLTGKTDIANARIIFENGVVGNLTASRVSDRVTRKIRIFQPDAYLAIDCHRRELSVTQLDDTTQGKNPFPPVVTKKISYPGRDPLKDEISSFVNAVINGAEPVVPGEDGRRALKYALEIIQQIEKGCKEFLTIC
ncbi:MAG: Gfo/Idh/MocA family oxidoreductase [Deltaproteobacteria bacterium]|nr:Gfo/Idh/MocA family oxidoreductase [Deltaproteobacteria bacterium]